MPFSSKAQRRFMYAAEARGDVPKGTASRWEKHTKNKNLPEHVKKASWITKTAAPATKPLPLASIQKAAQKPMMSDSTFGLSAKQPVLFNKGTSDSTWSATDSLGRGISKRYTAASNIVSSVTGMSTQRQVPSAGMSRNFLEKAWSSGRIPASDTAVVGKGMRALQKGEAGARSIMSSNYIVGAAKAIPFTWKSLGDKPAVDSAMATARKTFPKDFSAYSSYVKSRSGAGWKGDTTSASPQLSMAPRDTTSK